MTTPTKSLTAPKDQSATFIELFFDLVFVFAVTQTVGLLHGGLSWASVGQAVLVFWLVWWAWTQFTWALNAADTTHAWVELGTLSATAFAFFMAVAVPKVFGERALWFAATYVLVRVTGLALYIWVSWENPARRAAVRGFAFLSVGGFVAVLTGAFLGGAAQVVFWSLAALLDVAAARAGNEVAGWKVQPEHFGERHGLFVIITLGETLIVAGGGLTEGAWTTAVVAVAALAVAITGAFWWTYFTRAQPALVRALSASEGAEQAAIARESFSLLHFPMMFGVTLHAFVIEEIVAHPDEPLNSALRLALALGTTLFVGGMGAAYWRATGRLPLTRLVLILTTAVAVLVATGVSPLVSLATVLTGTVAVALVEQRRSVY